MSEIKVASDKLKDTLKQLLREGNVRRVVIRNASGRTLLDMPLTAGVAGAVLCRSGLPSPASWRSRRSSRS